MVKYVVLFLAVCSIANAEPMTFHSRVAYRDGTTWGDFVYVDGFIEPATGEIGFAGVNPATGTTAGYYDPSNEPMVCRPTFCLYSLDDDTDLRVYGANLDTDNPSPRTFYLYDPRPDFRDIYTWGFLRPMASQAIAVPEPRLSIAALLGVGCAVFCRNRRCRCAHHPGQI